MLRWPITITVITLLSASCGKSTGSPLGSLKVPSVSKDEIQGDEFESIRLETEAENGALEVLNDNVGIDPESGAEDGALYHTPDANQAPKPGCQAHFSGLLMSDNYDPPFTSLAFTKDDHSEWVGGGFYPTNQRAFPKAIKYTFDGIAVDKGTKVTVYEKPNFEGEILAEVEGPAVVNNTLWPKFFSRWLQKHGPNGGEASQRAVSGLEAVTRIKEETWNARLQKKFPFENRHWSDSNMIKWDTGSLKIECLKK